MNLLSQATFILRTLSSVQYFSDSARICFAKISSHIDSAAALINHDA
jgi:hypothetical protein